MPVATDFAICTSGMCGFRRFIDAIDGFDGLCDACSALQDEHASGLHIGAATECADCA
jgi:hypothetical protein